jgi:hypothetical protein
MESGLKKFIFAFLFIASFAYAAPIGVKTGDDLAKQINAGAKQIYIDREPGFVLYVDARIEVRRDVEVDQRWTVVRERVPNEDAAFYVTNGATLTVKNGGSITDGKSWFAIVDGGAIKLRKFNAKGTRGIFVPRGTINWIEGETSAREYSLYAGSVDRSDKHVAEIYAERVKFRSSEPVGESPVRIMGGFGLFYRCEFDSRKMTSTAKESAQIRHGKAGHSVTFQECIAQTSLSIRPLRVSDGSTAMILKYHAYAAKNPLEVIWLGGRVNGYTQSGGNTTVSFRGTTIGKDPRGVGGSTAITTEWIGGKQSKGFATDCLFIGWVRKGDSGVTIK